MNETLSNKEIIRNIVGVLKMTVRQFSLKMGIAYTRVFDLYSGRTVKAAPDIIEAIIKTYGINERYVTLGIGPMFKDSEMQQTQQPVAPPPAPKLVEEPAAPVKTEKDVMGSLTDMVATLMRQNQEKDTRIMILEDLLRRNNIEF